MQIDGISSQPQLPQSEPRGSSSRIRKGTEEVGDSLELTPETSNVHELAEAARTAPEASSARIDELRERVRSSYYNSPEVRQQIAASMLEAGAMRDVGADAARVHGAREELQSVPDTRSESVQQAAARVREGFYEDAAVRQEIAQRVLDTLT